MAYHYRANQYETSYKPQVLRNWEVPKYYDGVPKARTGTTEIIANDRGHLLPGVPKGSSRPWGSHMGTWDLPKKINRETADKLSGLAKILSCKEKRELKQQRKLEQLKKEEAPKKALKETPKKAPKEAPKEAPKVAPQEAPKEEEPAPEVEAPKEVYPADRLCGLAKILSCKEKCELERLKQLKKEEALKEPPKEEEPAQQVEAIEEAPFCPIHSFFNPT